MLEEGTTSVFSGILWHPRDVTCRGARGAEGEGEHITASLMPAAPRGCHAFRLTERWATHRGALFYSSSSSCALAHSLFLLVHFLFRTKSHFASAWECRLFFKERPVSESEVAAARRWRHGGAGTEVTFFQVT